MNTTMNMRTSQMKSARVATKASAARASRFARGSGSVGALRPKLTPANRRQAGGAAGYGLKNRSTCVVTYADASGEQKTIVIGLAADSGCGKSTFMRRVTQLFGGKPEPPKGRYRVCVLVLFFSQIRNPISTQCTYSSQYPSFLSSSKTKQVATPIATR